MSVAEPEPCGLPTSAAMKPEDPVANTKVPAVPSAGVVHTGIWAGLGHCAFRAVALL